MPTKESKKRLNASVSNSSSQAPITAAQRDTLLNTLSRAGFSPEEASRLVEVIGRQENATVLEKRRLEFACWLVANRMLSDQI